MFNFPADRHRLDGHEYKEVDEEEDEISISDQHLEHAQKQERKLVALQRNFAIFNVALLIFSIILLFMSSRNYAAKDSLNYEFRQVNTFSPILEQLELDLHQSTVNGSLYNDTGVIWRGEPSDEVDKAWARMARIKWFAISSSDVEKLGKDPSKTARIPDEWGYGTDTHFGALDSQHLIHCLNTLRKHTHPTYYNITPSRWTSLHLSHCTYLLLQALTCQPSLNVITHNWVQGHDNPFPDFNIERKCVNYDNVWEWNMERGIKYELLDGYRRPKGAWLEGLPEGYEELLDVGIEDFDLK